MNPAIVVVTLLAGGLAATVRYLVSVGLARLSAAEQFPWAVLLVNVVGSLLGGIALGLSFSGGISPETELIVLTGVCGGITTFSTFSVETIQLFVAGRWRTATANIGANLALGLSSCAAGFLLFS